MICKTRIDEKYRKYLEGKSVALVGPASYLTKLETGDFIDSHDLVVRINRGVELIGRYSKSIGKKTDILYNCLIESPDNGGMLSIKFYTRNNIDWISTIPGSNHRGECRSNKLHEMVNRWTVFKLKRKFSFHIMDHYYYSILNKKVNSRANTGFSAIFDLLNHDVASLYVTGFSFYLDEFIPGYKDGCDRNEKEFSLQCFNSKRHKQKPQWEYLKQIVSENKSISVDPILNQILSLTRFSRDEYNLKKKKG